MKNTRVSETTEFRQFFCSYSKSDQSTLKSILKSSAMRLTCYRGTNTIPHWKDVDSGQFHSSDLQHLFIGVSWLFLRVLIFCARYRELLPVLRNRSRSFSYSLNSLSKSSWRIILEKWLWYCAFVWAGWVESSSCLARCRSALLIIKTLPPLLIDISVVIIIGSFSCWSDVDYWILGNWTKVGFRFLGKWYHIFWLLTSRSTAKIFYESDMDVEWTHVSLSWTFLSSYFHRISFTAPILGLRLYFWSVVYLY